MQYTKQFTNQGLDLFSKALSEKQSIIIDQVLVDNLPTNSLPDLSNVTADDLSSHQSYQANYTSTDGSTLTVDSVMSNADFNDDYQVNEIAIMGHIASDQSTETLVAILTATDAFVLPKQLQGDSPIKFVPTIKIQYVNSNQSNVNVQVSDGAYVARQDLDAIFDQKLGNIKAASPDDLKAVQNALQSKADKSDIDNINSRINNINTSSGGSTVIPNNQPSNQPTNQFDENGITIGGQKVYVKDTHLMYNSSKIITEDVFGQPKPPDVNASLNDDDGNISYSITPAQDDPTIITSYALYYKADSLNDWQRIVMDSSNNEGEIQVAMQQWYSLTAMAKTFNNMSDQSQTIRVKGPNVPKATKLNVYSDSKSAGLDFDFDFDKRGSAISGYTVYYKKDSDNDSSFRSMDTNSKTGTINADKNITYDVKVVAHSNLGDSKESDTQQATYFDPEGLGSEFSMNVMNNGYITAYQLMYSTPIIFPNVAQVKVYLVSLPNNMTANYDNITKTTGNGIFRKVAVFPINSIIKGGYSGISVYSDSNWPGIGSGNTFYGVVDGLDNNGNSAGIRTKIQAGQ